MFHSFRTLSVVVFFTAIVAFVPGCRRGGQGTQATKIEMKVDPWAKMASAVSKFDDQSAADLRRVLEQLNSDLANAADPAVRPAANSAERDKQLQTLSPNFTPDDWAEVNSTSFTKLDAPYLLECQFFRESVRSLELADLQPADRTRHAFAWVCRLIYLNPVVQETAQGTVVLPPSPPGYVLSRGWGSGLERAYAFLAAVRQLGLDGCLIGPANSQDKPWSFAPPGTPPNSIPPGPFWAVGVRIEKDIVVFNPWQGEAAPERIVTLAQVKANPDVVKAWFTPVVTADVVKSSEPYLTLPVSAGATRWQTFEAKLNTGPNVYGDPVALRDAFGPATKFWCPKDPFDAARSLASFLPSDDGGRDKNSPDQQFLTRYRFAQMPRSLLTVPPELQNQDARLMLVGQSSGIYGESFMSGVTPREQIARGRFSKITADLANKESKFSAAAARHLTQQSNREPVRKFASILNDAYYAISRIRSQAKPDPIALAQAQHNLNQLIKDGGSQLQMLIDATVGTPSAAEATFLLALCKQEIAERFQSRADRVAASAVAAVADPNSDPKKLAAGKDGAVKAAQNAAEKWVGATEWWDRYESMRETQGKGFPGRAIHAKALADRARSFAGK